MTANDRYPHRLRLYGGRNTHTARELPVSGGLLTACDYSVGDINHTLPPTATITCRACKRAINRETR